VITTTTAVIVVVITTATTTVVARIWMIPGIIDETIAIVIVIVTIAVVGTTTEGEAIEAEVAVGNAMTGTGVAERAVRLPLRKATS
jgi:predicted metallopeptidase